MQLSFLVLRILEEWGVVIAGNVAAALLLKSPFTLPEPLSLLPTAVI